MLDKLNLCVYNQGMNTTKIQQIIKDFNIRLDEEGKLHLSKPPTMEVRKLRDDIVQYIKEEKAKANWKPEGYDILRKAKQEEEYAWERRRSAFACELDRGGRFFKYEEAAGDDYETLCKQYPEAAAFIEWKSMANACGGSNAIFNDRRIGKEAIDRLREGGDVDEIRKWVENEKKKANNFVN